MTERHKAGTVEQGLKARARDVDACLCAGAAAEPERWLMEPLGDHRDRLIRELDRLEHAAETTKR